MESEVWNEKEGEMSISETTTILWGQHHHSLQSFNILRPWFQHRTFFLFLLDFLVVFFGNFTQPKSWVVRPRSWLYTIIIKISPHSLPP